MTTIASRLQAVRGRIADAARRHGRNPEDISLLAVSKTWPAAAVRAAAAAGQRSFGENYVQEAVAKIAALADAGLDWHFIGPLQSNKSGEVAMAFQWLHSLDRAKLAQRLSRQRPATLPALNLCIQVNVSGEASKSGIDPPALDALADQVAGLPGLRLRGLMCVPEPSDDAVLLRSRFARLRELRDGLNGRGFALDTLSMGMSHDLEAAIAEGATIVRVGTAIFGERVYPRP
ncbi:MAG: YggS family pyridoxal phosphate-dependent enzyme [Rhodocyclaceae bacterium]|nr:YggS family pyridoxal phosphate-dependent enzyme [Rhodocyclaceae bacterium]